MRLTSEPVATGSALFALDALNAAAHLRSARRSQDTCAFVFVASRPFSPHLLTFATLFFDCALVVVAAVAAWRPAVPPASRGDAAVAIAFAVYYTLLVISSAVSRHPLCFCAYSQLLRRRVVAPAVVAALLGHKPSQPPLPPPPRPAEGGKAAESPEGQTRVLEPPHGASEPAQHSGQPPFAALQASLRCALLLLEEFACMSAKGRSSSM